MNSRISSEDILKTRGINTVHPTKYPDLVSSCPETVNAENDTIVPYGHVERPGFYFE